MQKNMLWNTVGCVFYQGCLWLTTVLVVRLSSGFDNSGVLALAMSLGNVYFAMASYNIRAYQISDIRGKYSNGQYIGMRIITVFISYALFALYSALSAGSTLIMLSILSYLLFKADEAFCNVLYGIDQRNLRLDYIGQSQILRGVLLVAGFSAGLLISNNLVVAILAMACSCFLVTVFFDMNKAKRIVGSLAPAFERRPICALMRECFPSVLSLVISGSIATAARQLFLMQYGESSLGIYATVSTPAVLIQVLAGNLYAPLLVPFAESFSDGNLSGARKQGARLVSVVLLTSLVITVALSAAGDWLLPLVFGASIKEYVYLFFPALLVAVGTAFLNVVTDSLVSIRRLSSALAVNIVALAATLITFTPFVTSFYLNGLSFTLIAGYGVSGVAGLFVLAYGLSRPIPQATACDDRRSA